MKGLKRIALLGLSLLFAFPFVACGGEQGGEQGGESGGIQKGYYTAQTLKINGSETKDGYLYYVLNVKDNKNVDIKSCAINGAETQSCTYTQEGNSVKIKIGRKEYAYDYNPTHKTLSFAGRKGTVNEQSKFKYDANFTINAPTKTGVKFAQKGQMLFDDIATDTQAVFNYCPTVLMEGDTMHVWYCTDEKYNENLTGFVDTIGYRQGKLLPDGTWVYSEKSIAVKPGRTNGRTNVNEWDYMQCCDPSVVKGSFSYQGESYNYLMAYLGSKVVNAMNNEIGLAVAKSAEGPWVKVNHGSETAFISYFNDENFVNNAWGIGQPSLINIDGQGKVLIFFSYTTDKTRSAVELWNLSNLDNPVKLEDRAILSDIGVHNGRKDDCMHNGDYMYDASKNRIYCITDEFVYANGAPSNVTDSSSVYYVELASNEAFIGETLFRRTDYSWNHVQRLDKELTGFQKVHNCGLVTDAYGKSLWQDKIYVMYTRCDDAGDNSLKAVGSYRQYGWEISI